MDYIPSNKDDTKSFRQSKILGPEYSIFKEIRGSLARIYEKGEFQKGKYNNMIIKGNI